MKQRINYSIFFFHGDPTNPTSESLPIIELSSHPSGEGKSDSANSKKGQNAATT